MRVRLFKRQNLIGVIIALSWAASGSTPAGLAASRSSCANLSTTVAHLQDSDLGLSTVALRETPYVGKNSREPLTFGYELEFNLNDNPKVLDFYRVESVADANWFSMPYDQRKTLAEHRLHSLGCRLLGRPVLVKTSLAPDFLSTRVIRDSTGNLEFDQNAVTPNLAEAGRQLTWVWNHMGPMSAQGHVVSSGTLTSEKSIHPRILNYLRFTAERAQFETLAAGAARWRESGTVPGPNLIHPYLAPVSQHALLRTEARLWIDEARLDPESKWIYGPVFRPDLYGSGKVGFELRHCHRRLNCLLSGMAALASSVENDFSNYSSQQFTPLLGLESAREIRERVSPLIRTALERAARGLRARHPTTRVAESFEETAYDRFGLVFRNWENHPLLESLPVEERRALRERIRGARETAEARIKNATASGRPIEEEIRIATAIFAEESGVTGLLRNTYGDRPPAAETPNLPRGGRWAPEYFESLLSPAARVQFEARSDSERYSLALFASTLRTKNDAQWVARQFERFEAPDASSLSLGERLRTLLSTHLNTDLRQRLAHSLRKLSAHQLRQFLIHPLFDAIPEDLIRLDLADLYIRAHLDSSSVTIKDRWLDALSRSGRALTIRSAKDRNRIIAMTLSTADELSLGQRGLTTFRSGDRFFELDPNATSSVPVRRISDEEGKTRLAAAARGSAASFARLPMGTILREITESPDRVYLISTGGHHGLLVNGVIFDRDGSGTIRSRSPAQWNTSWGSFAAVELKATPTQRNALIRHFDRITNEPPTFSYSGRTLPNCTTTIVDALAEAKILERPRIEVQARVPRLQLEWTANRRNSDPRVRRALYPTDDLIDPRSGYLGLAALGAVVTGAITWLAVDALTREPEDELRAAVIGQLGYERLVALCSRQTARSCARGDIGTFVNRLIESTLPNWNERLRSESEMTTAIRDIFDRVAELEKTPTPRSP